MEHIKKELEILLNKKGLGQIALAARVCFVFSRDKKDLLGGKLSAEPISFKNGRLRLKIENSTEASQIRLRQEKIKKELNTKLGKDLVKTIETIL